MTPEELEFYDAMKDRCRLSFEERGKMALIQQKMYLKQKLNSEKCKVESVISNWIVEREEFSIQEKPIKFDMRIFQSSEEEINNYLEGKDIEITKIIESSSTYEYIYVTQRDDGMVITVGKSTGTANSRGDLFYSLNTNRLSGTENIILRTEYGNETFKKYDNELKDYIVTAWMVIIESGKARDLERFLGDQLIKKEIPVLNYYSHRY